MGENEQLRELHDSYTWEVNAAVGEGRLDLVRELVDDYIDQAIELITAGEPTGCGRLDCAVCARPHPPSSTSRRRRWSWRRHGRRTADS